MGDIYKRTRHQQACLRAAEEQGLGIAAAYREGQNKLGPVAFAFRLVPSVLWEDNNVAHNTWPIVFIDFGCTRGRACVSGAHPTYAQSPRVFRALLGPRSNLTDLQDESSSNAPWKNAITFVCRCAFSFLFLTFGPTRRHARIAENTRSKAR